MFQLSRSKGVLGRYLDHTITAMSGVKGSSQLTLHLQSPAAAAAAQQAAEAAAAAAEADTAQWSSHEVGAMALMVCHYAGAVQGQSD
jgi:hypothetical protein